MATAILGLWAETSIHAGAGSSLGVIDLPVQREAHTNYPCVFGSSAKGALRTAADDWQNGAEAEAGADDDQTDGTDPGEAGNGELTGAIEDAAREQDASWIDDVFGPPMKRADEHAGALSVGDARLLLLPVRSSTSHFRWVTCPALLRRALRDWRRMGFTIDADLDAEVQDVASRFAAPTSENLALAIESPAKLFLEELRFTREKHLLPRIQAFLGELLGDGEAGTMLKEQLTIIGNDPFVHLARFATPVTPHIAIDNRRKRVKDGALWYEETLPPETVMYVPLLAQRSRRPGSQKSAQEVLEHVTNDLFGERPYLQIGGNETVGMGWFHVTPLVPTKAEASAPLNAPVASEASLPTAGTPAATASAQPVEARPQDTQTQTPALSSRDQTPNDNNAVSDQTIQQQRAAYASQQVTLFLEQFTREARVQAAKDRLPEEEFARKVASLATASRKKFKARASELPFLIHSTGLGQALAFFKSKAAKQGDKDRYGCLYAILSGWLTQSGQPFERYSDALDGLTLSDQAIYRAAQTEAILLMEWVKLLASASVVDDTGDAAGVGEDGSETPQSEPVVSAPGGATV